MPVKLFNRKRPYYRWGVSGKKYYFNPSSERSTIIAKNKATRQGQNIKRRIRSHVKK